MADKKVYILLTDTGSFFTKLIKLYTKQPYNHASISFDRQLTEVYSFGRKKIANPFQAGFVKEDMKQELFQQAACAIYTIDVTEEQWTKMKQLVEKMKAQQDAYRYNFIGLFGYIMKKPIKRKKALFCSEFVATVLKEGNLMDIDLSPSLIAPSDFQRVLEWKQLYEGKLKYYPVNEEGNNWYLPVAN